jgi:hypothetical protein
VSQIIAFRNHLYCSDLRLEGGSVIQSRWPDFGVKIM